MKKLYTVEFRKNECEIESINLIADDADDAQRIANQVIESNYYGCVSITNVYDGIIIHGDDNMSYKLNSVSFGELKMMF